MQRRTRTSKKWALPISASRTRSLHPRLTGTILPHHDSIINLRHMGYEVVEGKAAADFAMEADEAFAAARPL